MGEPRRIDGYWILYDARSGDVFRCPASDWRPYVQRGQFQVEPKADPAPEPTEVPPPPPASAEAPVPTEPAPAETFDGPSVVGSATAPPAEQPRRRK